MEIGTVMILVAIGLMAGMVSGFIGIGGGVIVVPALVYFLGMTQFEAQGTSLAMMIPPIGILGVMNYYKGGHINVNFAIVIAITFVIGGYLGSKLALKLPPVKVKFIFGLIMLYVSVRLLWTSGIKLFAGNGS
ncbi:MAG: sulfite exporter TauE/SafE family protein [Flavobacteriales bacterium]|jgi:hypothetical protein|nr:sulfite exporter TauE/SafE family protein [Bacteroidota bacterium]MDG1159128.1 sulfite exporter TauE/SafE family protein [Flavobacteriales bacterium]MDG1766933.1 sulfite exporter TauE/SafE family protein [Flavobacteriales bacterium]MDP4586762.1 sulfite exporter TauE/SafE family protein [Flavobacteriales bacterium]MDP4952801.1 sulfite exporter TauE/SafE family protein [Flavobacteriales bacterium]